MGSPQPSQRPVGGESARPVGVIGGGGQGAVGTIGGGRAPVGAIGGQRAQLLPSAFLGPSALGGNQPGAAPAQLPGASPVTSCGPEP